MKKYSKKHRDKINKKRDLIKINYGHYERKNALTYISKNKMKKNKKKKNLKMGNEKIANISNIISLLLFIISYYFYYLSLEKCFGGEEECILILVKNGNGLC